MYPLHITPQGKQVWDFILKNSKFRKIIFSEDNKKNFKKQWLVALIIFKRMSAKLSTPPFKSDPRQQKVIQIVKKES